jgi:thioester reductase-like protein
LSPPDQPASIGVVEKILDLDAADCAMITPSVLTDIAQSPAVLQKMRKLDWVMYGGSPLSKSVGDVLCRHSRLLSGVGSTEGGFYLSYLPEASEDWEYLHYHESMGIMFKEPDSPNDASREAVISRTNDIHVQHAFITFPDQETFATNDLYEQHPSKTHLWRYAGRKDDVIVLSNGEKLMPTDMEAIISLHPHVSAALIAGQGRFQPILIVEETPGQEKRPVSAKINALWSAVAKANEQAPGHGKIDKSHIMFLPDGQTFKRSNKGLVSRGSSMRELQHQIDDFYNRACEQPDLELLDCTTEDTLRIDLLRLVKRMIPGIPATMSLDDDLFSFGLDSLQTVQLTKILKQSFQFGANPDHPPIDTTLIYSNPSIAKIVRRLFDSGDATATCERAEPNPLDSRELLRKYARDMSESQKATVILTGSTGNFGSYILSSLLQNTNVAKVVCLNRGENGRSRQQASFQLRGLPGNLGSGRAEFLQVNLSSPHFGLPISTYNRLLAQTTHIIHNAWPVNFNQSVASFEPHILGCVNLIEFSRLSILGAHLFFISSIATARRWDISSIPEHPILNLNAAEPMGYGQSKLISEILFYQASLSYGIQTTICRVGQIAGPVNRKGGEWNRNEWIPSLIKSSFYLGMLPQSLPGCENIDWIPVDILADITVDLLFASASRDCLQSSSNSKTHVFHAVNPVSTHWSKLLPVIAASMPDILVVEYEEWLSELRRSEESLDLSCYEKNPAIKLLGYFNSLTADMPRPVFDTMQTCLASETMRNLPAVQQDWVARWMEQWGF